MSTTEFLLFLQYSMEGLICFMLSEKGSGKTGMHTDILLYGMWDNEIQLWLMLLKLRITFPKDVRLLFSLLYTG